MAKRKKTHSVRIPAGFPDDLLKSLPQRKTIGLSEAPAGDPDYNAEFTRRIKLLANYYRINRLDDDALPVLLVRVLGEWVPGFHEESRGRNKSDYVEKILWRRRLLDEVDRIKSREPELTNDEIAGRLFRRRGPDAKQFQRYKQGSLAKEIGQAAWERKQEKQSILGPFLDQLTDKGS